MSAFEGRVAVVTGAASGIGAALAEVLAERGARVLAADRDAAKLEALRSAAAAKGLSIDVAPVDVTDRAAVAAAIEGAVARHGRVDLLFNNAGVGHAGEVRDALHEDWRRVVDVNLWGVVHGIEAAYPRMVAQGAGQIVNTASGAGLAPRPGMAPYAASKHAVVGLSLSMRAEARAHGVRVNVVCPGHIATGIFTSTTYRGVDAEGLLAAVPTRPISARACAERILRGVARDRPVIIVGAIVRVEWWLFRLAPWLVLWLSEVRARAFRKHRKG